MSSLSRENIKTLGYAAAVFAAASVLYFLTAARDIVVGDTPELITAAVTFGVAHPPGYPLFSMLGHLFSLLPFGSIPFRVNLLAVTCDVLTVVSFGLLAAPLIILGMVQVYRHQRWYLWFSLIAFVCVGPLFVWMTNLNLATAPSALFVL